MQHSKSAKIFQLATSIPDSLHHSPTTLFQKVQMSANLFEQETPQQVKPAPLEDQRSYDYVGVKELKAYYERNRRVSKERRKDTINVSMGMSRNSAISKQEEELYNKWQVLQQIENRTDQSHINNQSIVMSLQPTSRQNTSAIPFNDTSVSRFRPKRAEFRQTDTSMLRLRVNFRNCEQRWKREEERAQLVKKGFPSLLRLATESQSISIKKALDEQKFKKQNIPIRMWATVLHEQGELRNIYNRPVTRYEKGQALALNGKNKLQLEKEWLNQKGDKGFRFQLIRHHKQTE